MADIDDILREYTSGEADLEETNAALQETRAYFSIDPGKNVLTEDEVDATVTGDVPEDDNGWGLLDTGTGELEKVRVTNGTLEYEVNQVDADGNTNMPAYVLIGGDRYEVYGDRLGKVTQRQTNKKSKPPNKPNLRRRSDLAGQAVMQHTKAGDYLVAYDDFGYAVSAKRVGRENGNH